MQPKNNRLRCGEIILQKTNKYTIIYKCRFCDIEKDEVFNFINHMLQHLTIGPEDCKALLAGGDGMDAGNVVEKQNDNEKYLLEDDDIEEEEKEKYFNDTCEIKTEEISQIDEIQEFENVLIGSGQSHEETQDLEQLIDDTSDDQADSAKATEQSEFEKASDTTVEYDDTESESRHMKSSRTNKKEGESNNKVQNNVNSQLFIRKLNKNGRSTPAQKNYEVKRMYKCEYCDATFKGTANLRIHRFRHLGIKPHSCTMCEKRFSSSTDLKHHIRSHTDERPFVCEDCGLGYRNSAYLADHRRRHLNERTETCETCGKKFYNKTSLRDHAISHTTERPFECAECGATFQRAKALRQHKKLHSDKKSYVCKICDKAFAQNAGLYSHMKQHNVLQQK